MSSSTMSVSSSETKNKSKNNNMTMDAVDSKGDDATANKKENGGGTKYERLLSTAVLIYETLYLIVLTHLLTKIVMEAFAIRLYAIKEFGRIIHEFDPYFNFRATQYLYEHGWSNFTKWFDYMVWYPLGRPVGTTIYPGMQVTAVFLKNFILPQWTLNDICCFIPAWFGSIATIMTGLIAYECSVGTHIYKNQDSNDTHHDNDDDEGQEGQIFTSIFNDIPIINIIYKYIIVIPVNYILSFLQKVTGFTFGLRPPYLPSSSSSSSKNKKQKVSTALSTPALECGLFTCAIMSIVPAHIMRSVGGGYDNESVAITTMTLTFYLWVRSLRGGPNSNSCWFGVLTGFAYFYMVATWGGYIFVINLIGAHTALLVLLGRYSTKLYRAYSLFYVIGTILAVQVPVVGWTPLRSLEQLGPCLVFWGLQYIQFCEYVINNNNKKKKKTGTELSRREKWFVRIKIFIILSVIVTPLVYLLYSNGYFGPISARVRGLFVKHTKTGNPLVDSVAEHQPASNAAYFQYLHDVCYIAPVGFVLVALFYFHDASSFLLVYGTAAYFFSHKMVRLILLTGPIASALGGVALGHVWSWCLQSFVEVRPNLFDIWYIVSEDDEDGDGKKKKEVATVVVQAEEVKEHENNRKKGDKKEKKKLVKPITDGKGEGAKKDEPTATTFPTGKINIIKYVLVKAVRMGISIYIIKYTIPKAKDFYETSHNMAKQMSHPSILFKAKTRSGEEIMVDDYREAYWWLRDNTPLDSRIMAWWDYGYQITAIANRTTIADGNTWNHEHIALLGRALTSPEREGHRIARHLADYVLIWAGGGGDDLAKSPHLARIANSVYRHMCPGDPTCRNFGFVRQGVPSPMMEASLLYRLHSHGIRPGVEVDKNRFKEVYTSKHGKVRIYKILSVSLESKAWVADPANRICDAEGSWFCRGQYPPALAKFMKEKRDFAQLEDFNRKKGDDEDYQKKYFEHLNDPEKAAAASRARELKREQQMQNKNSLELRKLKKEEIEAINNHWEDTEATTLLWELVSRDEMRKLIEILKSSPEMAYIRSADGRGPMWWAAEFKRTEIMKLLKRLGVSDTDKDAKGITPLDLLKKS